MYTCVFFQPKGRRPHCPLLFLSLVSRALLQPRALTNLVPHVHLCLHPAGCPLAMSQISLVDGVTMGSRACLAGEIALMQYPPGSLFLLLTHVLMLKHKCASEKRRQWWLRKDRSTHVQVSLMDPSAHRQFTPDGPGRAAPPVVPLFYTSASSVAPTREDNSGNTHKGDQSARSSVTLASVVAMRRSARLLVSHDDRVSARGSASSSIQHPCLRSQTPWSRSLSRRGVSRTRHTFLLQQCLCQYGSHCDQSKCRVEWTLCFTHPLHQRRNESAL